MGKFFETERSQYGLDAFEEQKLLNRIVRTEGTTVNKFFANKDARTNRMKGALKGGAIGTVIGAPIGAAFGGRTGALLGGIGGGLYGELIGMSLAEFKYLEGQGITMNKMTGRIDKMSPAAQKKYLKKV